MEDTLGDLPDLNRRSQNRAPVSRSNSISQASENSQTAQEYIKAQLQLEADAREALPYQFDTCTRPLGALRQSLFACLTCNPSPASPAQVFTPAGVCYSCSISCHGEHTLVELFTKRNFVCDCGTTRLPETSPCTLRVNVATGRKENVHSEIPAPGNKYNQNFKNRFCGCGEDYNPHEEKGTMFQCLGLGTVEEGGCGEDWWHPECVMGLPREWWKKHGEDTMVAAVPKLFEAKIEVASTVQAAASEATAGKADVAYSAAAITSDAAPAEQNGEAKAEAEEDDDPPLPPGFPEEDDFETFICCKCVNAFPWIKRYAGAPGFLPAICYGPSQLGPSPSRPETAFTAPQAKPPTVVEPVETESRKRKASEDPEDAEASIPAPIKRQKSVEPSSTSASSARQQTSLPIHSPSETLPPTLHSTLPAPPDGPISLFLKEDFRDNFCRCPECFPLLKRHSQLLEEEDTYEPPISEEGGDNAAGSVGTGSLLDRGEAALSNMDRVNAIEGVMAYNHLKNQLKSFLQPYAESGQAVGAEDIKAYFEKLRGDTDGIIAAAAKQGAGGGDGEEGGGSGDGRKGQSGY